MRSDIVLEQGLYELAEQGYLQVLEKLEQILLNDLATRMASTDFRDHMELVRVRGMIDGIKLLQSKRQVLISGDDADINLNSAQRPRP
jgi:hypothetical protein